MVISIKLDRDRSYHPKCRFISESTIFSCKVITWNYLLYWLHSINWKSTALNIPPPTRSTWILLHQSSPHLGFVWFHKYLFVVALTSLSRRGVKVEAQRVFIKKKTRILLQVDADFRRRVSVLTTLHCSRFEEPISLDRQNKTESLEQKKNEFKESRNQTQIENQLR